MSLRSGQLVTGELETVELESELASELESSSQAQVCAAAKLAQKAAQKAHKAALRARDCVQNTDSQFPPNAPSLRRLFITVK